MSLQLKKYLFYTLWVLIILVGPITLTLQPFTFLFSDQALFINFFQRLTGMLAFSLLFSQIIFGAYMKQIAGFVGGRIHLYHVAQGLIAYGLVLVHPFLYILFNLKVFGVLTILPNSDINTPIYELYITLGKVALVLLTVAVFAGYFRTKPFIRKNFRKLHILNYLAFGFMAIHAHKIGTDANALPLKLFVWPSVLAVGLIFIHKVALPMFLPTIEKVLASSEQTKKA